MNDFIKNVMDLIGARMNLIIITNQVIRDIISEINTAKSVDDELKKISCEDIQSAGKHNNKHSFELYNLQIDVFYDDVLKDYPFTPDNLATPINKETVRNIVEGIVMPQVDITKILRR